MKVKIKKLCPDAVIPYKAHQSDFCYDCVAISEEEDALIDMCQDLHRECLKLAEIPAKN